MEFNSPPDPAWDYCATWNDLIEASAKLRIIMMELQGRETSTKENDANLISGMDDLIQKLKSVRARIKPCFPHSSFSLDPPSIQIQ